MPIADRRWHLDDLPDRTSLISHDGDTYLWVDGVLLDRHENEADWFMVLPATYEEATPCA